MIPLDDARWEDLEGEDCSYTRRHLLRYRGGELDALHELGHVGHYGTLSLGDFAAVPHLVRWCAESDAPLDALLRTLADIETVRFWFRPSFAPEAVLAPYLEGLASVRERVVDWAVGHPELAVAVRPLAALTGHGWVAGWLREGGQRRCAGCEEPHPVALPPDLPTLREAAAGLKRGRWDHGLAAFLVAAGFSDLATLLLSPDGRCGACGNRALPRPPYDWLRVLDTPRILAKAVETGDPDLLASLKRALPGSGPLSPWERQMREEVASQVHAARPALAELLDRTSSESVLAVLRVLASLGDPAAIPCVQKLLGAEPHICMAALDVLGVLEAVGPLTVASDRPGVFGAKAIIVLGRFHLEPWVVHRLEGLRSSDLVEPGTTPDLVHFAGGTKVAHWSSHWIRNQAKRILDRRIPGKPRPATESRRRVPRRPSIGETQLVLPFEESLGTSQS